MRAEDEDTGYDNLKSISLIDLFIIVLKYKFFILSFVLLSLTTTFLYLNFFKNNSSQVFDSNQEAYFSEAWLELDTAIPVHFPTMDMTLHTSRILFSKYHLPMLHYMVWDETKGSWDIDKTYIWDEVTQKLTIDNQKNNNKEIPTLRIKPQNIMYYLTFSCRDPKITPRFLNDFINSAADYYRVIESDKVNSRIELYKSLLTKSQDKVLRDRFSDQLIVNVEFEKYIRNNERFFPYTVLVSPLEVTALSKNIKRNSNDSLLLVFIGFAAFIFILVSVIVYENLQNMKIEDPEKYSLLEKYLRFRG